MDSPRRGFPLAGHLRAGLRRDLALGTLAPRCGVRSAVRQCQKMCPFGKRNPLYTCHLCKKSVLRLSYIVYICIL